MKVFKFGGASVKDAAGVRNLEKIVRLAINDQSPTANDQSADLAAVAYALYLAGKKPKAGIIALPRIKSTAWNHKHYTLK